MKRSVKCLCLLVLGFVFLIVGSSKADAADKPLTVNRFLTMVYTEDKAEAIPIRNATVRILYYDAQGKRQVLRNDLTSDDNGEVKNVTVNVPEEITRIYFEYVLSRPEVGNIVNSKGITYRPITSWPIPENRTIDVTSTRYFINAQVEDVKEYNYQSIKIWNCYYDMVMESRDSVQNALDAFPQLHAGFTYSFKPITVLYENRYKRTNNPTFVSSSSYIIGEIKLGQPYINIPHVDAMNTYTRAQQDEFYNVNLSHEWGHWAMHLATGRLAAGSYSSHTGFNENETMSYKEGWAVFQANRYAYGYNWNWLLDNSIQRATGKYEFCYGRSTNWTVNSAFRDMYDIASPREPEDQYDIAQAWMPDVVNADPEYRQRLSTGLLFIIMANSKAKTFAEYVAYMEANDFIKDREAFNQIMQLNGFDTKGRFTIDGEGNPIVYE